MLFGFENEEIMGQRVGNITYRQLVKLGAVSPYELVVMSVKRDDIKDFLNNNTWVRDEQYFESDELQTRFIASIILADKAYKKGYTNKLLTFHSRNSHAVNFEKAMINLKDDSLFTSFNDLDFVGRCMGSQANTNKTLLNFLQESNKGVISNARVLTEGISVPCIDSVLFCDPKTSAVDLAQGISRSIRLYPGKDKAYVLLPVIIDCDGNIENDSYQRMIDLLDYLSGFDEVLEDEINVITQSQNRRRMVSSRVVNTDELEIDNVDISEFYNELSIQIWNRVKSRNGYWTEERLIEYVSIRNSSNELRNESGAFNALEANDYMLWKKLAPHIPLPNRGISEEECAEICLNYKGTYRQFRQDHFEVISRFVGLSELKSTEFTKSSQYIDKYCSHMKRETIQWKKITSQEVIDRWLSKCKTKKDARVLEGINNIGQKLQKPHLQEALNYYNELPNTPSGLKTGQRRGGGWKLK